MTFIKKTLCQYVFLRALNYSAFNFALANRRDSCANYPVPSKILNLFPTSVTERFFLTSTVVMPYGPELIVIIHNECALTPPIPRGSLCFGVGLFLYLCRGGNPSSVLSMPQRFCSPSRDCARGFAAPGCRTQWFLL